MLHSIIIKVLPLSHMDIFDVDHTYRRVKASCKSALCNESCEPGGSSFLLD